MNKTNFILGLEFDKLHEVPGATRNQTKHLSAQQTLQLSQGSPPHIFIQLEISQIFLEISENDNFTNYCSNNNL